MILLLAIAAQIADLATYGPALARNPNGELWVAALTSLEAIQVAKVIGIIAVAVGLAVVRRRHPAWSWYRRGTLLIAWIGVIGAATNVLGIVGG